MQTEMEIQESLATKSVVITSWLDLHPEAFTNTHIPVLALAILKR